MYTDNTEELENKPVVDNSINARLERGEIVSAGNGLYQICSNCGKMVKINKIIFGDLHICD